MKKNTEFLSDNKFMSFGRIVVTVIMLFIMGTLSAASMISTTGMEKIGSGEVADNILFRIRESWETVIYYSDDVLANIIILFYCFLFMFLLLPLIKKIPLWMEITIVATWTIAIGTIWIYSSNLSPTEDSFRVTNAAVCFAKDDFAPFAEGERYFRDYSYQLGYVLFNEVFIRLAMMFGEIKDLLFLQVINVFLLAVSYVAIILTNKLVFKDEKIRHITSVLLMFAAQPIIFSSFLYGIIPGFAFASLALLFMILYLKKSKIIYSILSVVFIALAVMIKTNNYIVLVAICCITFVTMFRRKKFIRDLIYIVAAIALSVSVTPAVKSYYENRSNIDLGEALPFSAWFAMGLNEAENAPGWYNPSYTVHAYANANYNPDVTSDRSIQIIKERIEYFYKNQQYRKEFFYKKFVSQWNETSYQSIWNNQVRGNYYPRTNTAEWICTVDSSTVKQYMDYYAQFIFIACLIGLLACLKNKNFLSITFPVVILGGVIYHILAEAKSQYSIPYFILMIGFAAYGIMIAYDHLYSKSNNNKIIRLFFCTEKLVSGKKAAVENTVTPPAEINNSSVTDTAAALISEAAEDTPAPEDIPVKEQELSENSAEVSETEDIASNETE